MWVVLWALGTAYCENFAIFAEYLQEMISRIVNDESVRRLARLLDEAQHVAIICHVGPDGDAVGSSLALAHVLGNIGKDAKCIIPDATSALLMRLPEARNWWTHASIRTSRARCCATRI